MKPRQHDPFAETIVLPRDELANRRMRKQLGQLSLSQIHRLIAAVEKREKAEEGGPTQLIEDHTDSFVKPQPVPEDVPIV